MLGQLGLENQSGRSAEDVKGNTIRIGLVLASDFHGNPPGGGQPTVEIFLKYAQERPFDIWLLGMSSSPEEPIGQASKRQIYGREYPFVPLFYFDAARHANKKPLIPVRIQTFCAYLLQRRLVDSMKFDLVYLHAPEALPFLWRKRQPILFHIHGPQEAAAQFARYRVARSRPFMYLYRKIIRLILEKADEFIVIDDESYSLYSGVVPDRKNHFHLLPTAIDVDQFRPLPGFDKQVARRQFGLPEEGKIALYVGRLSWKKGLDLILRGFALLSQRMPNVYLAVAGAGEDRLALEALTRELGIDCKVFFLGQVHHLPSRDLPCLYNCADVSVVASFHESLALVITEALACGTPVVSTRVGIASKVIQNGVTGFILETRQPEELALRLIAVLQSGAIDSRRCVLAASEYAETSKQICNVIEHMTVTGSQVRC